jgi:hypothetical protein
MRGIIIGDIHTANDWDLILNAMSVAPPEPKYTKVSIDGRSGDLNLSRALTGDLHYNNRPLSFVFLLTSGNQAEREDKINEIVNLIHGTEQKIILPDDVTYYFFGECSISEIVQNKAYASFRLNVDAEPYKYSTNEITRVIDLSNTSREVVLVNLGRKKLVPNIEVSGTANLEYGSTKTSLGTGSYKLLDLQLGTGNTLITANGSGTVTFTYREAML